jgi:hypothetical protein
MPGLKQLQKGRWEIKRNRHTHMQAHQCMEQVGVTELRKKMAGKYKKSTYLLW